MGPPSSRASSHLWCSSTFRPCTPPPCDLGDAPSSLSSSQSCQKCGEHTSSRSRRPASVSQNAWKASGARSFPSPETTESAMVKALKGGATPSPGASVMARRSTGKMLLTSSRPMLTTLLSCRAQVRTAPASLSASSSRHSHTFAIMLMKSASVKVSVRMRIWWQNSKRSGASVAGAAPAAAANSQVFRSSHTAVSTSTKKLRSSPQPPNWKKPIQQEGTTRPPEAGSPRSS
mmetsp:Transcript_4536/g.13383  ORF Transcript_4536/g.13383 Transcript_4536/m.13383 type:complete len:232 (-) Transcript_4536:187-882(-)